MDNFNIYFENSIRLEEIQLLNNELKEYKLSFSNIAENSPKHKDTRDVLLNIAMACIKNEDIVYDLKTKK